MVWTKEREGGRIPAAIAVAGAKSRGPEVLIKLQGPSLLRSGATSQHAHPPRPDRTLDSSTVSARLAPQRCTVAAAPRLK